MTGRWFHDTLGTPTQGTLLPLLFDVKYLDFETFCGGVQCSISECWRCGWSSGPSSWATARRRRSGRSARSEEHTSELQSPCNLVCRLLLEKKNRFLAPEANLSISVLARVQSDAGQYSPH